MVRGSDKSGQGVPTFAAKRGPLTISVVESGTIKARDQQIIKNEVEGRTSIITLVPEGTRVRKGDLLVELDASALQDGRIDQDIRVQNAEAAYINARENLAIVTSKADSDVNEAELAVEFARKDLRKYEQGQYPKDVNEMEMRIALAKEELERAEHTLEWSNRLFREKYISETEKTADELTVRRKLLEVELANANLAMLRDFTHPRQIRQYQSDVQQAISALDRAKRKAEADKRQAQADLTAKEAEFTRQKTKLQKNEDQIKKTKILAPSDGLVIYATSAKGGLAGMLKEPLLEGQQVFERQELIYLPTDLSAMAEVSIHEASLAKVRVGQPAIVTVETLPGQRFLGTVGMVAPLPDAAGMFLNPDLKVFKTQIHLDMQRPGAALRDDLPGGDRRGDVRGRRLCARSGRDTRWGRRAGLPARRQVRCAAQSRDRPGQQPDGPDCQRPAGRRGRGARSAPEGLLGGVCADRWRGAECGRCEIGWGGPAGAQPARCRPEEGRQCQARGAR